MLLVVGYQYSGDMRPEIRTIKRSVRLESAQFWPKDPTGELARLLDNELPHGFCYQPQPATDDMSVNVGLVAEWLTLRYGHLKVGNKNIFLQGDKAANQAIERIEPEPCSAAMIPL